MTMLRLPYVRFRAGPVVLTLLTIALMVGTGGHIVAEFRATRMHAHVESAEVFLTHFIEPYARAYVAKSESLEPTLEALKTALARHPDLQPKIAVRIWLPEGRLLYTSADGLNLAEHDNSDLLQALLGERVIQIKTEEQGGSGGPIALPFLEIYFPIIGSDPGRPIAIGELYVDARKLVEDSSRFEQTVWLTIGAAMLAVIGMLAFNARQSEVLRARLVVERNLVSQNEAMRREAEQARFAAAEANEQTLNYIGAEIHDGPLQLLSLASLMGTRAATAGATDDMSQASLVQQAAAELRQISAGLILPEIEALDTLQVIELAVSRHRSLTGASVDLATGTAAPLLRLDLPRRICLYRVVQESLANATRHGGEGPIRISLATEPELLIVSIESRLDPGSGATPDSSRQKLGLQGMRRRISVFNGTVDLALRGDMAKTVVALPASVPMQDKPDPPEGRQM